MSQTVPQQDRIVAVMGPTGAGKSTFINHATGQDGKTIGHKLRSFTAEIRPFRMSHPTDGQPVVFVDTPGFDDTYKSDVEILTMIADWLVRAYKGNVNLTTIIYMHEISACRMTGSILKNLRMFAGLCGQKAMPRVIITTTKWTRVGLEEGEARQKELTSEFWEEMVAHGCRAERFGDTYDSAWKIIGSLAEQDRETILLLPQEIVDARKRLNETTAGLILNKELEKLLNDREKAVRRLEKQAKKQNNELVVQQLNQETAEIDEKIRQTAEQLRQMKVPFRRKVVLFFKNLKGGKRK